MAMIVASPQIRGECMRENIKLSARLKRLH